MPIQTGPGAHPVSCTIVTASFPGIQQPGRGVDHPPHLAPRLKKEQSFIYNPPRLHALFWGEIYFSLPSPLNSKLYLVCIIYSSWYRTYLVLASSSMGVGRCGVLSCERTSRTAPVFLLWLYGPCRTLATFRITFQASMSLAVFLQPLTPIIFKSFSTPSNRLPLSRLSNSSFPFWDNLKHILRSSFFCHYSHMS